MEVCISGKLAPHLFIQTKRDKEKRDEERYIEIKIDGFV